MRSTDDTHTTDRNESAQRFGALVRELAEQAGYDLTNQAGGKAALARDTGMSQSAIGRMVEGRSLPVPYHLERIARTLNTDVRTLLVNSGVISDHGWRKASNTDVISATSQSPLSPEAAADQWGITDPGIRSMLISSVQHAIRLQNEADSRRNDGGEALRRR